MKSFVELLMDDGWEVVSEVSLCVKVEGGVWKEEEVVLTIEAVG
jgi:hypothetical protein